MLEVSRYVASGNPSFCGSLLQLPNTRTKKYGNESLSFRGSIIWNQLPDQYKVTTNGNEFKKKTEVGRDLDVIAGSAFG